MIQRALPIVSVVLLAALALPAAAAWARSPEQRIGKFLARHAVAQDDVFAGKFKPRYACACTATGLVDAFAGFLVLQNDGKVHCAVGFNFDASGEILSYAPCGDFEVLGR